VPLGATVDARGILELSSGRGAVRHQSRHRYINDIVWRHLACRGVPASKKPLGLVRVDGKRSDGLTLVPQRGGRPITWNVTTADVVAHSCLAAKSITACAAAEATAERKTPKEAALMKHHLFAPIAIETLCPICMC
jgi:hypothetical protein